MIFVMVLTTMMIPQGGGQRPVSVPSVSTFERPDFQLDEPSFRPWVERAAFPSYKKARQSGAQRNAQIPSATVEVVEALGPDRQQRLLDFNTRMIPLLEVAYDLGYASRTSKQMLAEFMAMDPSHPRPPSIPSVYYNQFKPPPENPAIEEMKRKK